MKNNSIFRRLSLLLFMLVTINCVKAQVYSDGTCVYRVYCHNVGNVIIRFDGNSAYLKPNYGRSYNYVGLYDGELRDGYKHSTTYVDDLPDAIKMTFDSELSTSARVVYKTRNRVVIHYIAVSKDLATIKCWTKLSDGSLVAGLSWGGEYGAAEGVRVDPEIFKPKAVNYDFLND